MPGQGQVVEGWWKVKERQWAVRGGRNAVKGSSKSMKVGAAPVHVTRLAAPDGLARVNLT